MNFHDSQNNETKWLNKWYIFDYSTRAREAKPREATAIFFSQRFPRQTSGEN